MKTYLTPQEEMIVGLRSTRRWRAGSNGVVFTLLNSIKTRLLSVFDTREKRNLCTTLNSLFAFFLEYSNPKLFEGSNLLF